jgi:hypothetical protein
MVETDRDIELRVPRHLVAELPDRFEAYAKLHPECAEFFRTCARAFRAWLSVPGSRVRCSRSWASWGRLANVCHRIGPFTFAAWLSAKLGAVEFGEGD